MKKYFLAAAILIFTMASQSPAQLSTGDFLLHFDGSYDSSTGEPPTEVSRVRFEEGIKNQGAYVNPLSHLQYSSEGKINPTQGTIEFWLKPNWNSNDGLSHPFFTMGEDILIYKSTSNQLKCYLRNAEGHMLAIFYNFPQVWTSEQWHHIAISWKLPGKFKLYIDGYDTKTLETATQSLYRSVAETISIGRWRDIYTANAVIDELRVSKTALSVKALAESFAAPLQINSLTPQESLVEMFQDWNMVTNLLAETQIGTVKLPLMAATAMSRNNQVALVNEDGRLQAVAAGTATIGAVINEHRATFIAQVRTPAREPEYEEVPKYLQEPTADCLYTVPVVMIKYLPTRDGVNVDSSVANYTGTLDGLTHRITQGAIQTKFMLEEGSRFHGYKEPLAQPSIGYRVVASLTIYEDTPPGFPTTSPDIYTVDYNLILKRIGAGKFVQELGVKEFWLWTYHHGNITPTGSNMSSPTTGDISNSYRFNDDMPVYDRTYTLYNYNFTRGANENVQNHGRQLESMLDYVNRQQDGNFDLFWGKFVGLDEDYNYTTGRCGWTLMPPNTTTYYDYGNMTLVPSDIEKWTPEGLGRRTLVNAATWRDQAYLWPEGSRPTDVTQPHWYIYWMQSMPGRDNHIPYLNTTMTNWWAFTGEWDESIHSRLGLYANPFTAF